MSRNRLTLSDAATKPNWHARLCHLAGLDFHVFSTLLFRGWGILAGACTMILLPVWLSPAQQGYYYTFASLLSLQVFFELGFSQVIVQLVSHEAAHLILHQDGELSGEPTHLARMSGIVSLLRHWYAIAALLFTIIGWCIGWLFFNRTTQTLPTTVWAPVWATVVLLTALNLFLSPQLAVIEGSGQVGQVARLRLRQSIVGYCSLWGLLVLGAQLWVTIAVPLISAVGTLLWLRQRKRWFTSLGAASPINWRQDIFPLQWRIAVSWACGYFIFNLFTPIVFSNQGAVEAGRLGMGISVFNAVTTLGLSWINAKAPLFTMHISRGESESLNHLFRSVAVRSTAATALLGFGVVGMVTLASYTGIGAIHRISPPIVLFWIACAAVANTLVYAAATYMRAHREEPMLPVSVVSAIATVLLIWLLQSNVSHMMMGYAFVGTGLSLPWSFYLLQRYRARHVAVVKP